MRWSVGTGTREDDVAEDVRGDDLVRMLDFEPVGVGGDEHQRVTLVLASEDAAGTLRRRHW